METIGVYVHIPYCVHKCPYCDFNSYAVGKQGSASLPFEAEYVRALLSELRHFARQETWSGRQSHSIFFGGGTPSLFSAEAIAELIAEISRCFPFAADAAEVTLEANPGTIQETLGLEKLEKFRRAGVNRVSMGAQSFAPRKLSKLGRIHSPADTDRAVANILAAGFDNFNLDLIFGVGDETLEEWEADLQHALSLTPAHISAYGLTIEPGTEFSRQLARGTLELSNEDTQAALYCRSQEVMEEAEYAQYEISNYAKPGRACRHNLGYWNGEDYLGLGAGAHSYCSSSSKEIFGHRWSNIPGPQHYIERALSGGAASQRRETIDQEKAELEFFFLRLRTARGALPSEYEQRFGRSFSEQYAATVRELQRQGLLEEHSEALKLSKRGFLFADEVLHTFARSSRYCSD
jgi:oxygen-independent coproporphyrinogen-3 oxidase